MSEVYKKVSQIVNPVYEVGGSVRNSILGLPINDYDFATPLLPDEVEKRVKDLGYRPYLTGKRFGTIGVKIDGQLIDITTFRGEGYTPGNRKPEVKFHQDIVDDLRRRDFTINAIASEGNRFIDPFGGRKDIERGVIKSVGNPTLMFKDDPLRMLRMVRFSSQLKFKMDLDTFKSALRLAHHILDISKERWVLELDKILLSSEPGVWGLPNLVITDIMKYILPEIAIQVGYQQKSKYHKFDLWTHTCKVVDGVEPEINLRWAALLHDVAKPFVKTTNKSSYSNYVYHEIVGAEMSWKIGRYLKWSNDRLEKVTDLVKNHLQENSPLRKADNNAKL